MGSAGPAPPLGEEIDRIRALPRPRAVRLRPRAYFVGLWNASVCLVWLYWLHGLTGKLEATYVWPACVALTLLAVLYRLYVAKIGRGSHRLLAEGEVASGLVYSRSPIWGRHPGFRYEIGYRYSDQLGRELQGKCIDLTDRLRIGMTVPVLFNPLNPAEHVALCSTYYELAS